MLYISKTRRGCSWIGLVCRRGPHCLPNACLEQLDPVAINHGQLDASAILNATATHSAIWQFDRIVIYEQFIETTRTAPRMCCLFIRSFISLTHSHSLQDTPDEPQPSLIIQSAASSNSAITLDTLIETAPVKSARLLLLSLTPRSSSIVLEHPLDSVVVPDILAVCVGSLRRYASKPSSSKLTVVGSRSSCRSLGEMYSWPAIPLLVQCCSPFNTTTLAKHPQSPRHVSCQLLPLHSLTHSLTLASNQSQLISLESNQRIKGACFTARSSQLHLLVVQRPAGRPASFATLNRQDTAIEYTAELRSYACLRTQDSEPQQPLPSPEPGQSQSDGSLLQEILLLQQQLLHRMTGLESRFDSFVSQFNQRMSALETQIATPDHR